ncbi:hypothetical protein AKJ09_07996 [Labilithrix luteola]|uniref:Uncharacterized protein n=1 Tax=Labilithrix luteola TaxID=1391654 RepID=A0A0K1Q6H3_9BACT|nr:hypothetical protein AKJ09_07996 [Labilithrix luteola]
MATGKGEERREHEYRKPRTSRPTYDHCPDDSLPTGREPGIAASLRSGGPARHTRRRLCWRIVASAKHSSRRVSPVYEQLPSALLRRSTSWRARGSDGNLIGARVAPALIIEWE